MYVGGGAGRSSDELGVTVDVDVVLEAKVVLPAFLCPACIDVLLRQFAGLLPQSMGTASCLMMALSSRPLRWIGTGTKVASMICPALEFNTEVSQRLTQAIKQGFGQLVCLEGFSKCPDGAGIGYVAR
jgi:hypothetical protein